MTATVQSFPHFDFLGLPVELSRIEPELQRLFMEDLNDDVENRGGVARASLMNLAVYNENRSEIETDNQELEKIAAEAACRSILISADNSTGESSSSATAWVQARCQIGGEGGKTVCTEQVSFCIDGDSPGLVRNIVFANLDSDLPLVYWWRGEFSDTFEERLYSRIDRLIFDSESWESPRNQFLRLGTAQKDSTSPFVVHDLAFTRLNPLRQAIASLFDRPKMLDQLSRLKNVRIRYREEHRMSGLYLCGWLAFRLQTSMQTAKSTSSEFHFVGTGKQQLNISVSEAHQDENIGIVAIDFEIGDQKVEITRCQARDFLRTTISDDDGKTEDEDWLPVRSKSDASLVVEILTRGGKNRGYLQMLPLVNEMLAV